MNDVRLTVAVAGLQVANVYIEETSRCSCMMTADTHTDGVCSCIMTADTHTDGVCSCIMTADTHTDGVCSCIMTADTVCVFVKFLSAALCRDITFLRRLSYFFYKPLYASAHGLAVMLRCCHLSSLPLLVE